MYTGEAISIYQSMHEIKWTIWYKNKNNQQLSGMTERMCPTLASCFMPKTGTAQHTLQVIQGMISDDLSIMRSQVANYS